MKRLLQHSKTGLFLSVDGGLTRHWSKAHICPNLAAAMIVCARQHLNPTDFVYRIVEPEVALLWPEFYDQSQAA